MRGCYNFKQVCKELAEAKVRINGTSDLDVLLGIPADQWTASMRIQMINQVGYDIRNNPSEEELRKRMEQLNRVIRTRGLDQQSLSNVLIIPGGHWDDVPRELSDAIETISRYLIPQIVEQDVSDKSLLSVLGSSNPEMLERILGRYREKWSRMGITGWDVAYDAER